MRNAQLIEHVRQLFGVLNGDGTHQHWAPLLDLLLDILDNGLVLLFLSKIDEIRQILTDHWLIGWQHHGV